MSDDLPDYTAMEPPEGKPPEDYSHHERRAALLRAVINAGSPYAVNGATQAERFGVHRSTISRDMDRLRESLDENLDANEALTVRAIFERTILELQHEDDWRAQKAAFDVAVDFSEWLAARDLEKLERRIEELEANREGRR